MVLTGHGMPERWLRLRGRIPCTYEAVPVSGVIVSFNPALCAPRPYFADLTARLKSKGIPERRLCLAAEPPIPVTQFSRWKNKGIDILLSNVGRIERAFAKLTGGA